MKQRIVQLFGCLFGWGCLGRGNVAEHQLGQFIRVPILPDLHDVVHALIDLGSRFIGEQLVDDTLVQSQLATIRGDFEHIIYRRVHTASVYFGSALGECFHHLFLVFGRLGHNVVIFYLRGGQVQLVGGFDVRHLFEQVHQLRQVKELGKPCPCPVACSFRSQF